MKFRSKFNHGFTIIMAIYKVLFEKLYTILTLLMMGPFFEVAHGLGGPKKPPSLKYVLHILQWWHLAQLYHTQRRSKKYISRDTPLEFYWHQHFFTKNQQILLYQEIQIQIAFEHLICNSFNFFESLKAFLIMVGILMMSAKLAR